MANQNSSNAARANQQWPFQPSLQRADLRSPPAWSVELAESYPFRLWARDIIAWCCVCPLRMEQRGAAVELALGGAARDLVREMDMNTKMNGFDEDDGNGNVRHVDGVSYILRAMQAHSMPAKPEM